MVEYVSNQMGGINLLVNGYSYLKNKRTNGNQRWVCALSSRCKCSATIIQDGITQDLKFKNITHNHGLLKFFIA